MNFHRWACGVCVAVGSTLVSIGQCVGSWQAGYAVPGPNYDVTKLISFDDGSGPSLIVGGGFTAIGSQPLARIARWNGSVWSPLGSGLNGDVTAMTTAVDGAGASLYVAGNFTNAGGVPSARIARWDGTQWFAVPTPPGTAAPTGLAVFDAGSGPELYASGSFLPSGVARLTAAGWVVLPGHPGITAALMEVRALVVASVWGLPRLYATGRFALATGFATGFVAQWDGHAWAGTTLGSTGYALAAFDPGLGPSVYVAGQFASASGVAASNVACIDGPAFGALGSGVDGLATCLLAFDDGNGPALHVAGNFNHAGGLAAPNVARWNGAAWSVMAAGLPGANSISSLTGMDWTSPPTLCVGGRFTGSGSATAVNIAAWNGTAWSGLPSTSANGFGSTVAAAENLDLGNGAALHVAGHLVTQGFTWDGVLERGSTGWLPVGPSLPVAGALGTFDAGSGPHLYCGAGSELRRLDGGVWTQVGAVADPGAVLSSTIDILERVDDGVTSGLYVGGHFATVNGVASANIARWDGTSWHGVGGGVTGTPQGFILPRVNSLVTFDDGAGPSLFASGYFSSAGGLPAAAIARWDGFAWSSVGGGVTGGGLLPYVLLAVYDDGTGRALYAGGPITAAGGTPVIGLARWNGQSWSPVAPPTGVSNFIPQVLKTLDDGSGPALYCATNATIHRLRGATWETLPSVSQVQGLARFQGLVLSDDGSGPAIFARGSFDTAGGIPSGSLAKWGTGAPTVVLSQMGSGGFGLTVDNAHLIPTHDYANVFSLAPCGVAGSGPYLGLCASDPSELVAQVLLPPGTPPFRFVATSTTATFGPYSTAPGITIDGIVIDVTGSPAGCHSPVGRRVVQ